MKLYNKIMAGLMGALLIAVAGTSCKKDMETYPRDWFGEDLVFDTLDRLGTVAAFNLNDLYNYIPGGFNRINGEFLDDAAGEAVPSRNNTTVEYFTNGRITVLNNPDPYWANSYYGIRRANIFLKNITKVPIIDTADMVGKTYAEKYLQDSLARQNRRFWKAEARFIRTLMYFELLKRYGGVPLVGDTVFTLNDNLQIPRNNFAEVVDYIVSECDLIKDSLRKEPIQDADLGRITRGAAYALKLRTLLYAASPLFNGGGFESDPVKKALTGYPTYDASRWNKVITAAEQLKGLGVFSLATATSGALNGYGNMFVTKKNNEVILAKQSFNNSNIESQQAPVGFGSPAASQGLTSPSQNFVDAFPMSNGLAPFNADGTVNTASGYDPAKPYTGRDPRLNMIVFTNGTNWLKRPVETFEGGKDKPNKSNTAIQTKTGYYLRKFMGDFTNQTTYSNQSHNFILFRYAEVLLSYAEALNEAGRVEDAVKEVMLVRARAGLGTTATRNGIKTGITQDEMRELIRNERRIELSFEEHRFWDIRRWKIADKVLSGPVYGMKITNNNGVLSYEKVVVANMVFNNKLYHMPIPYDETTKNLALIQNEGW